MSKDFTFPIDLQEDLLSFLIRNYETWLKFSRLIYPQYFSEYQLQDIFVVVSEFAKKYEELPQKSVLKNLVEESIVGSQKQITDYTPLIDSAYMRDLNEKYLNETITTFVKIKCLSWAVRTANTQLDDGMQVLKTIELAIDATSNIEFDPGYSFKEKIKERNETRAQGLRVLNPVPTLMAQLDVCLDKGLGAGELGCVVASPNRGKSIVLINFAINAAMKGKKVVYFTLGDMSAHMVGCRMDGHLCKANKYDLKNMPDKVGLKVAELGEDVYIKYFPQGYATIDDIKLYLSTLLKMRKFKPDLVVVDMAEYIKNKSRSDQERFRLKDNFINLHGLAGDLEIPIWTAHQANVYNFGKEEVETITGIHLAESKIGILGVCDFIFSANQTKAEERILPDEKMRFYVIKQRDGKVGDTFCMLINKSKFTLKDSTEIYKNPALANKEIMPDDYNKNRQSKHK